VVLCLLVYSFAEWMIRKGLKDSGQSIPDQKGKPTQKPTLKWICFLFYGVAEVTVEIGKKIHREIANLKDSSDCSNQNSWKRLRKILWHGGINPECGFFS